MKMQEVRTLEANPEDSVLVADELDSGMTCLLHGRSS